MEDTLPSCPFCLAIPIRQDEEDFIVPHKKGCFIGAPFEETSTYICGLSAQTRWNNRGETDKTKLGPLCLVRAAEIVFELDIPMSEIRVVAKDIYDHPSQYSDYSDDSEASYYNFLKYLYITFPDGKEERLVDFIEK